MAQFKKTLSKKPSELTSPKDQEAKKMPEKTLISWSAPEFIYYEKTTQYFIIAGIFVIVLVILMVILKEWMTVIAIFVTAAVLYIYSQRKPQVLKYGITNKGVNIGARHYPYSQLKSFWIIENPSASCIHFEPTKRFSLPIIAQLGNLKTEKIKKVVKKYLPEKTDQKEDLIDKIFRMIRF